MNILLRVTALGLSFAAIALTPGCSGTDTKLTPKEAASIRGNGQMPPQAQQMMEKKMAEARTKMAQQMQNRQ